MKMIPIAAALAFSVALPALAQQPAPPATTQPAPPAMTQPGTSVSPGASTSAQPHWFTTHNTSDMRASKLIGMTVRNNAGENIGDINEILLDNGGKVAAVVLGVGGFLGIGEREVAISFDSLHMARAPDGKNTLTVNATKDTLRSAPAWTWPRT